jgi:hypothetical protein
MRNVEPSGKRGRVGAVVEPREAIDVGSGEGFGVGMDEDRPEGVSKGRSVGWADGIVDGLEVDSIKDGLEVDGIEDGRDVFALLGVQLGSNEASEVGIDGSSLDGFIDGMDDGFETGVSLGVELGIAEVSSNGVVDGMDVDELGIAEDSSDDSDVDSTGSASKYALV